MKAALIIIVVLWAMLGWLRDQGQHDLRERERVAWQAYAETQADTSNSSPTMIVGTAPAPRTAAAAIKQVVAVGLALIPAVWFHSVLVGLTLLIAWRAFQA